MLRVVFLISLFFVLNAKADLTKIGMMAVYVKDYDAAKSWYHEKLGWEKRADNDFGNGQRFVTMGIPGQNDFDLVLYKGEPITDGSGILTMYSDDITKDVQKLAANGVKFLRPISDQPWGYSTVLEDLYGQSIVIVQLK